MATWFERAAGGLGRTVVRRAASAPRLTILIFHRVPAATDPLFPNEMHAASFRAHLGWVARMFTVMPLRDAVRGLKSGKLPPGALAITFDDGYADNHDVAMPILRELGLPATVFVSTRFLDGGRMWNDSVIECLRRTQRAQVDLSFLGLGHAPTTTPIERRAAIERVLPVVKYQTLNEREASLQALEAVCGHPLLPTDLMLTTEKLRALHRGGFEIGAHTRDHPILKTLDLDEAREQITASRDALSRMTGEAVNSFAYPNGRLGRDYDPAHAVLAEQLGFDCAVSTDPGVCRPGDDLFRLRRFSPWAREPWRWASSLVAHHVRG